MAVESEGRQRESKGSKRGQQAREVGPSPPSFLGRGCGCAGRAGGPACEPEARDPQNTVTLEAGLEKAIFPLATNQLPNVTSENRILSAKPERV